MPSDVTWNTKDFTFSFVKRKDELSPAQQQIVRDTFGDLSSITSLAFEESDDSPIPVFRRHSICPANAALDDPDNVPWGGVAGGIGRRAVQRGPADRRATVGRLTRGSSPNWPTLSSVK
jgi:hypothetical protein